nr:uncharacterized protein LOC109781082 [Aegilops tauschii subsp. strangulata]
MERAPQDVTMRPQEEPAPAGQQAVEPSALFVPEGGSEPPVPQAILATASPVMAPANAPVLPPPQALALADCGPLIRPGTLDDAHAALEQLGADLQDGDRCLMRERLVLISGWLQADTSAKTAWGWAEAAIMEGRREDAKAKEARDTALANAASAEECRAEAEAKLKALQDEQASHNRRLQQLEEDLKARKAKLADRGAELAEVTTDQAAERGHLDTLNKEVADAQASHGRHVSEAATQLEAREKALGTAEKEVAERDAFPSLELKARDALSSIWRGGYEEPLATPEEGLAGLSSKLAEALRGAATKVDSILEEYRSLFRGHDARLWPSLPSGPRLRLRRSDLLNCS